MNKSKALKKIFFSIVILLFFIFILSRGRVYKESEVEYGVTFSKKQIINLNLDWKKAYLAVLDELGVKKLRLPVYWDEVEPTDGEYSWEYLDWQVNEAERRSVELILAVGGRLPRWPECHFPGWTDGMEKSQREEKILKYLESAVSRYKENKSIVAWQVENEPFLSHFGDCPELDSEFLDKEIKLVRSIDSRPIVVTDSGELSVWVFAAKRADIFGTTMYRDTYSKHLKRYIHYPIKPGFFRFKKNIASIFAHPDKWIVIELQAEPWAPLPYQDITEEERSRTMDLEKFKEILEFSRKSSFREFYLWGAEWWYWEKMVNNDPAMWNEAKKLF